MYTKHIEKLNNDVSRLRKQSGLTQQQLADMVSVTRQTIIAIEKGDYVPSVLLAIKIAKTFKSPLEEVFFYDK